MVFIIGLLLKANKSNKQYKYFSKNILGHVDPGESEIETAWRETREESGLTENDLKLYKDCKKVLNYQVKGKPKIVYYWLAELSNPNATVQLSHEHQDFKWLELQEACKISEYKDMQDLLNDFHKYIEAL